MENEKRKVGDYTVLCAVNIGSREIILAENEQSTNGERFLCCYGERNDIFEKFTECAVGGDYIDATANVCFIGMESLEKIKGTKKVNAAAYDRVYDGKMDCISLENIYQKFNVDHPADYKGRSLSVSDVVEIRESDTLNPGFYFVDSIGFKSISFDKSLCKEPVNASDGKISVLLVEPNKYPKMIEIDDTLEAMQEVVGGDIEEYMPFEDEVAIICNEEGKVNGLTPNRAVYGEPQAVEMTFAEMRSRFCEAENEGKEHLSGYIVFTQDSFDKPYDERSRTYGVSSNNKAFQAGMGGYSIFGSCLDGTDPCVRLDGYMFGENAWKIEKCYMIEPSREMLDIICGKFFTAYAPFDAEKFQSLPPDLAEKYREKFKFPERFMRVNNEIVAVPFKPVRADKER